MDPEALRKYIEAFGLGSAAREERLASAPFITISRQAGAGGRSLARTLINALDREKDPVWRGWSACDRELCQALAADPRLNTSLEELAREEYRTPMEDYAAQRVAGAAPQERLLRKERLLLRAIARRGKAVVVGRAACHVTRDLPGGVHIRLVGSFRRRSARLAEEFCLPSAEAERCVREQDASRARLVRSRFHRDIDDPLLYDALWNTDRVPLGTIASACIVLLKARWAALGLEEPAPR